MGLIVPSHRNANRVRGQFIFSKLTINTTHALVSDCADLPHALRGPDRGYSRRTMGRTEIIAYISSMEHIW